MHRWLSQTHLAAVDAPVIQLHSHCALTVPLPLCDDALCIGFVLDAPAGSLNALCRAAHRSASSPYPLQGRRASQQTISAVLLPVTGGSTTGDRPAAGQASQCPLQGRGRSGSNAIATDQATPVLNKGNVVRTQ